jgi:transposase InsO family protein
LSGPIPARVDAAAKHALLDLIDQAVAAGWTLARTCASIQLDRVRAYRWLARRSDGTLEDKPGGGTPIHAILPEEVDAIIDLFTEWGPVDLSHRKLAHRGSYLGKVWVSPSTVDRVLTRHGLSLRGRKRPARSAKTPWPDWAQWRRNQLWVWDMSQFERCTASKCAYGIIDLVTRKWIATILTPEPTGTSVRVLFLKALESEGLLDDDLAARLAELDDHDAGGDQPEVPLLLAISDNGTEMRCRETAKFMAICSIAQHFGRPGTPTDQAWIESLWGHVKNEHPHLMAITDPAVLAAELERVRVHYNTVRLHEAIGYVTPDDEHEGRGEAIRQARVQGLADADARRRQRRRAERARQETPS